MIRVIIPLEDLEKINSERFRHPDPIVARHLHVLYCKSLQLPHQEICNFVDISRRALVEVLKQYAQGGLAAVMQTKWKDKRFVLDDYREIIEQHFRTHPPESAKVAAIEIEKLIGLHREIQRRVQSRACEFIDVVVPNVSDQSNRGKSSMKNVTNLPTRSIYRNNLKNREYAKEAPRFYSKPAGAEAAKLEKFSDAGGRKIDGCPTPAETDSSSCFGIAPWDKYYLPVSFRILRKFILSNFLA